MRSILAAAVGMVAGMVNAGGTRAATTCEALGRLGLPNVTVTSAAMDVDVLKDLPAFCRVAATLRPTSDSDIRAEVWLPSAGWNGKLMGVGNGGWAGSISHSALALALQRGYAAVSTDTGHTGGSGSFALGHPEKFIDFAYRSEHEMTVTAKALVRAFYGRPERHAYWNGCSTGGRQGLMEAQRFPGDYDGVIAGAAANPRTRLHAWAVSTAQANLLDPAGQIPADKYPVIHNAVMAACDALDGLADGLIDDPTRCHFDPRTLECRGADASSCLTSRQVPVARRIMSPARHPATGAEIYPGLEPGSELGWGHVVAGPEPNPMALDSYRYVVFKDPRWDWRTFDLARDVEIADRVLRGTVDAVDPHLEAFVRRGGKLLMYHGWSDTSVAPQASVRYYQSVLAAMGGAAKTAAFIRLFMLPGAGHCGGGDGPNSFDAVGALEAWVEKGAAPDRLVAGHATGGKVDRTRPLCPYPQVARYVGKGSTDDAASFVCGSPRALRQLK